MNKPELIIVYQTNPFEDGQGGGVRYVKNLVTALELHGAKITFFGTGEKPQTRGNIRFIPIMKHPNNTVFFIIALMYARIKYIGSSHAVVHVHRLYYSLPFLGKNTKCVATLHGRTFTVFQDRFGNLSSRLIFPIFKLLEEYLLKNTEIVIPVSQDVKDQFIKRHGENVDLNNLNIIPSMVNLSKFKPTSSQYFTGTYASNPVCLFVGRLASVKNIPLLLESWKLVVAEQPALKLAIAGDGELHEEVTQLIIEMGLSSSVMLTGHVASNKICSLINSSRLLVLTSHHEASPTVIKEALSCGVPVATTAVGDVAEIIDDGITGLILNSEPAVFATGIINIISWNSSKEDIAGAAKPILSKCSPEAVAGEYLKIYGSLGYLEN